MTVYNRRDKTLSCIENCFRQIDALAAEDKYEFTFFLNDDGSTDGLSEAIRARFPQVVLTSSQGDQYWIRGLCSAWNKAAEEDFDFYIWLDYALQLADDAFRILLENSSFLRHRAIIVGTVTGPDGKLMYGGRTRSGKIIEPDPIIPTACGIIDGNLVLVPKYVFKSLGTLDIRFSQSLGDYDYAVRAIDKGITRVIAPGVLAKCERLLRYPIWRNSSYSLKERYRAVMSPKGRPFKELFLYDLHNSGVFIAIAHFIKLNLLVLFPKRW